MTCRAVFFCECLIDEFIPCDTTTTFLAVLYCHFILSPVILFCDNRSAGIPCVSLCYFQNTFFRFLGFFFQHNQNNICAYPVFPQKWNSHTPGIGSCYLSFQSLQTTTANKKQNPVYFSLGFYCLMQTSKTQWGRCCTSRKVRQCELLPHCRRVKQNLSCFQNGFGSPSSSSSANRVWGYEVIKLANQTRLIKC